MVGKMRGCLAKSRRYCENITNHGRTSMRDGGPIYLSLVMSSEGRGETRGGPGLPTAISCPLEGRPLVGR